MKAVALDFNRRMLLEKDVPEPKIEHPGQVLLRILEVGVCGTDRDLASFRLIYPPEGDDYLVLGHECVAEITQSSSPSHSPGDIVVPIVRRPCCPACEWCGAGRRDLCASGRYSERGIVRAHGYFTEIAVDYASDLVIIPPSLLEYSVLVEPLSVVEKAIGNAFRLYPGKPETALVLGAGSVGLLAAMGMHSRGLDVTVCSLEPEDSQRAHLARAVGAEYTNSPAGDFHLVIEAAGALEAAYKGLDALAPAGVFVALGVTRNVELPMLRVIMRNQVIVGSVNAAPSDFAMAVKDLARFPAAVLSQMIFREPWNAFASTLTGPLRPSPKVVHVLD